MKNLCGDLEAIGRAIPTFGDLDPSDRTSQPAPAVIIRPVHDSVPPVTVRRCSCDLPVGYTRRAK
jgi:hypothetical protein